MRIWGVSRRLARQPIAGRPFRPSIGEEVYRVLNQFALGFLELSSGTPYGPTPSYGPAAPAGRARMGRAEPLPGLAELDRGAARNRRTRARGRYLALYKERARPMRLSLGARNGRTLPRTSAPRRGEIDDALTACERAVREHRRTPGPFERGRTLLALGSAQRRARRLRDARETLQTALTLFERARRNPVGGEGPGRAWPDRRAGRSRDELTRSSSGWPRSSAEARRTRKSPLPWSCRFTPSRPR